MNQTEQDKEMAKLGSDLVKSIVFTVVAEATSVFVIIAVCRKNHLLVAGAGLTALPVSFYFVHSGLGGYIGGLMVKLMFDFMVIIAAGFIFLFAWMVRPLRPMR